MGDPRRLRCDSAGASIEQGLAEGIAMKTYYCTEFVGTDNMDDFDKSQLWRVCKATEAEARIAELERALQSARFVLKRQQAQLDYFTRDVTYAVQEADQALGPSS
jgi:uncharacterized coiled-coil protein SlyX